MNNKENNNNNNNNNNKNDEQFFILLELDEYDDSNILINSKNYSLIVI